MTELLFLRVLVYHNTTICNIFVAFTWDIVIVNEENGFRSLGFLPTPCANLPNSFPNKCFQTFCVGHIS